MNFIAHHIGKTFHALRRLIPLLALTAGLAILLGRQCALCFAADGPKIAATVNGVPITQEDVEYSMDGYIPPGAFHMTEEKRERYRKPALDGLIDNVLLAREAKVRKFSVDEGEIDESVKKIKGGYKDENGFEKALADSGVSLDEFRERIRKAGLTKKILKVEAQEKSKYAEKELEEYYNANKEKFLTPESFRIRQILLKVSPTATDKEKSEVRGRAEALLKRVKAGGDFAEFARNFSEDDYKTKGGDLGWVHKGELDDPSLEEAVVSLRAGETSGLVETRYGCHIVKLEEMKPAEQLPFSVIKDALREELESAKYKELRGALIKGLREKAKIEIY